MIYLDYAANTPVDEAVLTTFCEVSRQYMANPNSTHKPGQQARTLLEQCSESILSLLGAQEHELVYTSGASEANNLAIKGTAQKYRARGRHIITTMLEHSSVSGAVTALQTAGFEVDYLDVEPDGSVSIEHLKELLREDTILVSICCVDSELGTRQAVEAIGQLLGGYPNCHFHVDATQAVGKVPLSLEHIDLLTFAPHKFYGLCGCGVLVKKRDIVLEPLIHGGISDSAYRSGTPALSLIAATERALSLACSQQEARYSYVAALNSELRQALARFPLVRINSPETAVPFILNLSLPGVNIPQFIQALEQWEVYTSSKSACCAPNTPSRPVYALTKDRKRALSTLRVSLSHLTTKQEIEGFLKAFSACYEALTR